MNRIKRALISVSDKTNLKPLLNILKKIKLISLVLVEHLKKLKN